MRRALLWLGLAIPVLIAAAISWAYLRDVSDADRSPAFDFEELRNWARTAESEHGGIALPHLFDASVIPAFDADRERERTVALDLLAWRNEEAADSDALAELAGICEGDAARRAMTIHGTLVIRRDQPTVAIIKEPDRLNTDHPCHYARGPSPTVEGAIALIDAMEKPPTRTVWFAPAISRAELQNLRAWAKRARSGEESDHDYVLRLCARIKAYDFDLVASPPDRETVDLWDTLTDFCGDVSTRTDLALDDAVELIAALSTE